eukprot:g14126.t1
MAQRVVPFWTALCNLFRMRHADIIVIAAGDFDFAITSSIVIISGVMIVIAIDIASSSGAPTGCTTVCSGLWMLWQILRRPRFYLVVHARHGVIQVNRNDPRTLQLPRHRRHPRSGRHPALHNELPVGSKDSAKKLNMHYKARLVVYRANPNSSPLAAILEGSTFGTIKVSSPRTLIATAMQLRRRSTVTQSLEQKAESGRSHNLISKMAPVSTTFQTESLLSKRQPDVDNMHTGVNAMAQRAIPETVHHHYPDHVPLACQR